MIKKILIWIGVCFFLLEASVGAMQVLAPSFLFPDQPDPKSIKCAESDQEICTHHLFHANLGWNTKNKYPYGNGIRERSFSEQQPQTCGAAFGDSFTYSNDIQTDMFWTALLSEKLSCEIVNYGVGGYSYVQSILKQKLYNPKEELIIFLIYEEMLKRSLSSSTFHEGGRNADRIWPKPFLSRTFKISEIPTPLTNSSLREHVKQSWYSNNQDLSFPLFWNWFDRYFNVFGTGEQYARYHSGSTNTYEMVDPSIDYFKIFVNFMNPELSKLNDKKVLLAFLPSSDSLSRHTSIEERMTRMNVPKNVCLSNPAKKMLELNVENKQLLGPTGHFNETGDNLLAEAIYDSLKDCWPEFALKRSRKVFKTRELN